MGLFEKSLGHLHFERTCSQNCLTCCSSSGSKFSTIYSSAPLIPVSTKRSEIFSTSLIDCSRLSLCVPFIKPSAHSKCASVARDCNVLSFCKRLQISFFSELLALYSQSFSKLNSIMLRQSAGSKSPLIDIASLRKSRM